MEHRLCDQCSVAVAHVYFDMGNDRDLAMCGHHADLNMPILSGLAVTIIDMRHQIEAHA